MSFISKWNEGEKTIALAAETLDWCSELEEFDDPYDWLVLLQRLPADCSCEIPEDERQTFVDWGGSRYTINVVGSGKSTVSPSNFDKLKKGTFFRRCVPLLVFFNNTTKKAYIPKSMMSDAARLKNGRSVIFELFAMMNYFEDFEKGYKYARMLLLNRCEGGISASGTKQAKGNGLFDFSKTMFGSEDFLNFSTMYEHFVEYPGDSRLQVGRRMMCLSRMMRLLNDNKDIFFGESCPTLFLVTAVEDKDKGWGLRIEDLMPMRIHPKTPDDCYDEIPRYISFDKAVVEFRVSDSKGPAADAASEVGFSRRLMEFFLGKEGYEKLIADFTGCSKGTFKDFKQRYSQIWGGWRFYDEHLYFPSFVPIEKLETGGSMEFRRLIDKACDIVAFSSRYSINCNIFQIHHQIAREWYQDRPFTELLREFCYRNVGADNSWWEKIEKVAAKNIAYPDIYSDVHDAVNVPVDLTAEIVSEIAVAYASQPERSHYAVTKVDTTDCQVESVGDTTITYHAPEHHYGFDVNDLPPDVLRAETRVMSSMEQLDRLPSEEEKKEEQRFNIRKMRLGSF